ncbi:hypothetical protein PILCRDRAFT_815370 [Piloderma croceum F 1598]|uniref:Uncharacterized protein n=1 Tax=Piloderma croceum (strain F 1598) TaxID=765440 RepID=A0A0C3CB27_PILCF|nr:hypothetical protein PILCRDRAFT_815370 [Piloderma croceum F 1598]
MHQNLEVVNSMEILNDAALIKNPKLRHFTVKFGLILDPEEQAECRKTLPDLKLKIMDRRSSSTKDD